MRTVVAATVLLICIPASLPAQNGSRQYRGEGYLFFGLGDSRLYCYRCGAVVHVGGGGDLFLYKGLAAGAEVGYAHWGSYTSTQAWVGAGSISYHFRPPAAHGKIEPFILAGGTGFFPTSEGRGAPAGHFGGGVNFWLRERTALRLEIRDTVSREGNGYPGPHYISFRVGVTFR